MRRGLRPIGIRLCEKCLAWLKSELVKIKVGEE
jgi:hypothetical protein